MNVIEEKKGKLVFELIGASHTLCNLLKKEMWEDKNVKSVGYTIKHPLIGKPEFIVETTGDDPKKVVMRACQKLKKDFEKFFDELKKEVK